MSQFKLPGKLEPFTDGQFRRKPEKSVYILLLTKKQVPIMSFQKRKFPQLLSETFFHCLKYVGTQFVLFLLTTPYFSKSCINSVVAITFLQSTFSQSKYTNILLIQLLLLESSFSHHKISVHCYLTQHNKEGNTEERICVTSQLLLCEKHSPHCFHLR